MALDLTSVLTLGQGLVEDLMLDACTITAAPDGTRDDTLDPVTLELDPVGRVPIYSGKCKISARNPSGQTSQAAVSDGGDDQWAGRYTVALPLANLEVPPGSDVFIDASRDPWLAGKTLRVIAPTGGTFKLSRKIECELREGG